VSATRTAPARRLSAHGMAVTVPAGWDGSIRRAVGDQPDTPAEDVGPLGTSNPVLHVASFPLPTVRGDYGGGAVERMGPQDVFIALVEFDPEAGATPLFSNVGIRLPLRPSDFDRVTMHRPLLGASGHQQFFHVHGRAFALYVALGAHRLRAVSAQRADRVLATLSITRR
jgi:hypothetical protein